MEEEEITKRETEGEEMEEEKREEEVTERETEGEEREEREEGEKREEEEGRKEEERKEEEKRKREEWEYGEMIYNVGPRRIERETADGGNIVKVVFTVYPIYPYCNSIKTYIKLDKKTRSIEVWETRNNWGGSKTIDIGAVQLTEDEFDKLLKKVMKIKDPDDFEEITETFERMLEERKKRFDEILETLVTKFAELYIFDDALSLVKNIETLKELKKVAINCIKDWLAS